MPCAGKLEPRKCPPPKVLDSLASHQRVMNSSDHKLNGCRVFIVEDEHLLAMDLEDTLKSQGARIIGPYDSLDAAYRRAERDHFDVGIIDINLRDESPYQVADELMRQ